MPTTFDDTLDTDDTSIDLRAVDGDHDDDAFDPNQTLQEPPPAFEDLDPTLLNGISGGMRWEQFRRSTNVEDRRSPKAIARDQRWWDQTMTPTVPLPPSRPPELGGATTVPLPPARPDDL